MTLAHDGTGDESYLRGPGPESAGMSNHIPFRVSPMLLVPRPFSRVGWVYEEKYDGYRILAYKEGPRAFLLSRNERDRTRILKTFLVGDY